MTAAVGSPRTRTAVAGTAWLASRWARLNGAGRVQGVDLARGLAVIGMLAAHLIDLPAFEWTDADSWGAMADGRSSILFATLAGVSIGLISGGTRPVDQARLGVLRGRLAVRAVLIWTIGICLVWLDTPVYVILPAYGLLFLLVLPVLRLRPGGLLVAAAVLAVTTPFVWNTVALWPIWAGPRGEIVSVAMGLHYPFVVWIVFVLAGLGLARLGVARTSTAAMIGVAGAALAMIGYGIGAVADETVGWWSSILTSFPHSSGVGEVVGSGGFALAVIAICVLVCRTPVRWLLLPVRAVGSMPLTAYSAQLLVWALFQRTLSPDQPRLFAFRGLEPFLPFTIAALIACTAWALLVGRGPLEWTLDQAARFVVPDRVDR